MGGAHNMPHTPSTLTFALEDVSQVASACCACDLNACHAKGIVLVPVDSTRQLVVERWPATATVELRVRPAGSVRQ